MTVIFLGGRTHDCHLPRWAQVNKLVSDDFSKDMSRRLQVYLSTAQQYSTAASSLCSSAVARLVARSDCDQ